MMQRTLHIDTRYLGEIDLFGDKISVDSLSDDGTAVMSFDNFEQFNGLIFSFFLKTYFKSFIYKCLGNEPVGLNGQEQLMIYGEICSEIDSKECVHIISRITAEKSDINLGGIFHFRLCDICDDIREMCSLKTDEYILRNEYLDFIRVLRFFASVNYGSVELLNVVMRGEEYAEVLDRDFNIYSSQSTLSCTNEMAYIDDYFEYDNVISALVEASPKTILLHNWQHYGDSELIETLINIFDERIKYCSGCSLCTD